MDTQLQVKKKIGRPLKYQPAQFEALVNNYFDTCIEKKRPFTITGLCLHLDTTRELLREYGEKKEFGDAIKRAKLRVENYLEEGALTGKLREISTIFNLKNNFGWKDTQDHRHEGQITHGFVALPPLKAKQIEPISVKTLDIPHS